MNWTHVVAAKFGGFGGHFMATMCEIEIGSVAPVWSSIFISTRWRSFSVSEYVSYRFRKLEALRDVCDCTSTSINLPDVLLSSRIDRGCTSETSRSNCVCKDGSIEMTLPKSNVSGDTPMVCLTEVFKTRSIIHNNRDQFLKRFLSNKTLRLCVV